MNGSYKEQELRKEEEYLPEPVREKIENHLTIHKSF